MSFFFTSFYLKKKSGKFMGKVFLVDCNKKDFFLGIFLLTFFEVFNEFFLFDRDFFGGLGRRDLLS